MNLVMQHPAQQANSRVVAALIQELRACRTPVAYDEFQRRLFQVLHSREEHKGECRRCACRLQRGRRPPDRFRSCRGGRPGDPETWRIEDLVFDRICRQLRAVGDGMARIRLRPPIRHRAQQQCLTRPNGGEVGAAP